MEALPMHASRTHRRPGYTLLEIICVMVILIIVTALTVPVIQTMMTESRVSAAGDVVRGKLAEARARAMDEGVAWKLGFIANTGYFQLAPEDSPEWEGSSQEVKQTAELIRDELPKEVIFALKHEDIFNSTSAGTPGSGWETIAVFHPDGSAREDSVIYFGRPGIGPMRAKLRGLTGTVDIQVYKAEGVGEP